MTSSSRSLSGELLCLYSVALDSRFQLVSFWLPILCERPRLARRLDDVLSSTSSAAPPCALSEPEWWKSWRRFSKLRAHGPSFCQFTLWKAMMQCRLPPTCEQGSFLSVRLRPRTLYIISDIWKKQLWDGEPFWFCGAESPSLCDGCPGILGFVCWGQSRCPSIWKETLDVQQLIYIEHGRDWTETELTFYSESLGVSCWALQWGSSTPFHLWGEGPFTGNRSIIRRAAISNYFLLYRISCLVLKVQHVRISHLTNEYSQPTGSIWPE